MNQIKISRCFRTTCITLGVALGLAGCSGLDSTMGTTPQSSVADKVLTIRWQRVVNTSGSTCDRCGDTERAIEEARRALTASLKPLGLRVSVVKSELKPEQFALDPAQSNQILINQQTLSTILGGKEGTSTCAGVCGGSACRTLVLDGNSYEAIPPELIVRAGLKVAANMVQPPMTNAQSSSGGCCGSPNAGGCSLGKQADPIGKLFDTGITTPAQTPCCPR